MAEPRKKSKGKPSPIKKAPAVTQAGTKGYLKYLLPVLALTFLLFIPVLRNGFTNWDDILYVTSNPLLKDLSFSGLKAIFSTPVVSNYHPLTILSLALNYQVAELTPWTYHLTSIFLHVINTFLVFWFIFKLSAGNKWVSAGVALLFGMHPMHVESVVWISERKDLLYTLFYLLAMIVYLQYLQRQKIKDLIVVTLLGGISLLCKPAAIVLPLSLLLLDYFYKRKWSWAWVVEKLPLFIMAGVMAYVTVHIQSARAIESLEYRGIAQRISFAGFGLIWYLLKIIVPYPLSALHPFPKEVSGLYYLATVASVAGVGYLLYKIKNRNLVFGFGFYIVNLLLVLQVVSIGNAVVAERYTYVPYISIFFMLGMWIYKGVQTKWPQYRTVILGVCGAWLIALAAITVMRIPEWKTSESLWVDVLKHYPESPRAWTNKSLEYFEKKEWDKVIDGLTNALKYDPHFMNALEWRARAYLETNAPDKAYVDADLFHKLYPNQIDGLFLLARSYELTNQPEKALEMYNQLIPKRPNVAEYTNNRGALYFNKLKRYEEAKKDFARCIEINPQNGTYFLNLSRCYYMMNDNANAVENAMKAKQLGVVDSAYSKLIGVN
ncbi:MAG TPA: tetratricopeptide repeat protein [Saprospiraceae bacterium]|nr:tetratricopeptide repeat protein [Saprospiraceae bacterium]